MVQINRAVNKALKRKHWQDELKKISGDGYTCPCGSKKLKATRKGVLCRKCGQYAASEDGVKRGPVIRAGEEVIRNKPSLFKKYLGWGK